MAGHRFVEHRWGVRLPIELPVRIIRITGGAVSAHLTNVSFSGAYVSTQMRPPTEGRISLEINLRSKATRLFPPIAAFVVRHDEAGIGIEWDEFGADVVLTLIALAPRRS